MIFDDISNKLNSFQSQQNEVVVKLLSKFEDHFYSGSYNFKLNKTYEALNIPNHERIFDPQSKKENHLSLVFNDFKIQYYFDANYPKYFIKSFNFSKNDSSIRFYFNCITIQEESLSHIVYDIADNSIKYSVYKNQLSSIDFPTKELNYYATILKNIDNINLRDILLICHDLKIEKNDSYDCFISLLNHVQSCINNNNYFLNKNKIGNKNAI